MSFVYKNPLTSTQLTNQESVERNKVFGTNFSVLQTGGYMEVYTLNDLIYSIPAGATGLIQFSGNSIPINYSVRTLPFLPDTISLNSDGISSGRRRLGMLVYVHETDLTYQYTIPNFETLWDSASGSTNETTYGYSVTTQTPGGQDFINAWLDSSIEGVSGVTRSNARWKIFYGTDITVTGGTYSNGTATFTNTTGGTFNVTGFTSGSGSDTTITGGTYNLGTATLDLNNSTGGTVNISGVTGQNIANTNLTLDNNRVLTLNGNDFDVIGGVGERLSLTSSDLILSAATAGGTVSIKGISQSSENRALVINTNGVISYNNLSGDTAISALTYNDNWGLTKEFTDGTSGTTTLPFITGGTWGGGELNLDNALGNSISITVPEETDIYVSAATFTEATGILTLTRTDGNTVGAGGWSYVKSITENNNNFTVTLNDGSQSLLGVDAITGLGYDGDWGLSGTSTGVFFGGIDLPFVTAGTYSNGTLTLNLHGTSESDIQISGFDSDDTYLTGATYTPTTLTLGMSDDTVFNVTGFAPEITGGTYSNGTIALLDNTGGQVDITGITQADISIYNTNGQLTGDRVVDQDGNHITFSGGSMSVGTNTTSPVCAVLELASETQGLLIPRMTQEQRLAINTPIPGLLVYCTNSDGNGQEGMFMYKSNGWVNVL